MGDNWVKPVRKYLSGSIGEWCVKKNKSFLSFGRFVSRWSSSSYSWVRFGSNQVSILHLEGIPPGVIYNWRHSCGSLRQVSQWKVAGRFNIQVLDVWSNIFQSLIRTWNHFWLSIQWPLADSTLALFSLQPCLESFDKTFWGLIQRRLLYP